MKTLAASLLLSTTSLMAADAASIEAENKVEAILQRLESDVLAFRDEVERAHALRCDSSTLSDCARSNYNDCTSTYPNQQCMRSGELVISDCGDGTSCNALWDKTQTTIRLPASLAEAPNGNPGDQEVVESVCYSRLAEPYMIDNYNNQMYFGSSTGAFRIIPARHSKTCGRYDPRRRPWYVAASSGPKDVVLVIDTSGSMLDYNRMNLAKEAAKTIVDTLTVADRVAIVAFSERASQVGGYSTLIRATKENKNLLINAIDGLQANGATNFYDAFDTTFQALETTIKNEQTSGCNVAVLFLTDGESTAGAGDEGTIALVNERTELLASQYDRDTTIFAFSLGEQADHDATKTIACSTGGIWTKVDDFSDDLVTAMSSYYKLYALGLGEAGNEDFTAWVEPYEFYTAGKMGTSVSAPVYDRSVSPPLFLGVVAVDMYMDDLEEILGEDASSSSMLDRFVLLSTARCPRIELTEVERDALRSLGGGAEATCGASNFTSASSAGILPEKCFQSDWPNDLWENTDMEGREYVDRACCESGGAVPSDVCGANFYGAKTLSEGSNSNTGMYIGIAVIVILGAVAVVGLIAVVLWRKKKAEDRKTANRVVRTQSSINEHVLPVPPPTAPHMARPIQQTGDAQAAGQPLGTSHREAW